MPVTAKYSSATVRLAIFNGTVGYWNCLNAFSLDGLSPEDRSRIVVDLVQQVDDVGRRLELVIAVGAEITVAPVQRPGGLRVAEPGDGEPCPFRAGVLAPGRAALDDRQLPGPDVALDADLVPDVLGDALFAPAADAGDV